MELYINNKNVSDITYLSELTPHHFLKKCVGLSQGVKFIIIKSNIECKPTTKSGGGSNSHKQRSYS